MGCLFDLTIPMTNVYNAIDFEVFIYHLTLLKTIEYPFHIKDISILIHVYGEYCNSFEISKKVVLGPFHNLI
jgi:hypothetical protein